MATSSSNVATSSEVLRSLCQTRFLLIPSIGPRRTVSPHRLEQTVLNQQDHPALDNLEGFTPATTTKPKITLSELQSMEEEIDRIYAKSISLSEQTRDAIFKVRHRIRLESTDKALAEALRIINCKININRKGNENEESHYQT